MEVPIGIPVSLPVQVVATGRMPPLVLQATITRYDGAVYDVDLGADPTSLSAGDALVLDLEGAPLVQGHVDSIFERVLRVAVERTRPREPREFPRSEGGLQLRYAVAESGSEDEALTEWIERGRAPESAAWRTPAALADWSASGVGIHDPETCGAGDRLFLEITPVGTDTPLRAVGRVIRAAPLDPEEAAGSRATHRFAIDLEQMPPGVREALLEHTIEAQQLPGESEADAP
jgi:hypothetical protein